MSASETDHVELHPTELEPTPTGLRRLSDILYPAQPAVFVTAGLALLFSANPVEVVAMLLGYGTPVVVGSWLLSRGARVWTLASIPATAFCPGFSVKAKVPIAEPSARKRVN